MSAIPPNWLASSIQAHGAQDRAAETRRRERAEEADRAGEADAAALQNVIENSDRDSEVYSDAEGAGSQGRPHGDGEEPAATEETDAPPNESGLDIEA